MRQAFLVSGFPEEMPQAEETTLRNITAIEWNDNVGAAPAEIERVAGGVVTDLNCG